MEVKTKFIIKEIEQDNFQEWNTLLANSEDGTIFHTTEFLDAFKAHYRLFIIYKGSQEKAGILCQVDPNDRTVMKPYSGIIHDGFFFKNNFVDSPSNAKRYSAKFEIIEFALEELLQKFKCIRFSLIPEMIDMRPFLWVNYHSPNPSDKFTVGIRYTSIFDIKGIQLESDLTKNEHFKNLSNSRRQEIRYGIKAEAKVLRSEDFQPFYELYLLMAKNYDPDAEKFIENVKRLEASSAKKLRLYYVIDNTGVVVAASIFSVFNNKACYLYGVTSKENRDSFSGSFILWESFKNLATEGITIIDLEGVNSPQRGWFKLSFGGELKPYYHVTKSLPQS